VSAFNAGGVAAGDPATAARVEEEALRAANAERSPGMVDRVTRHLEIFSSGEAVTGSPT